MNKIIIDTACDLKQEVFEEYAQGSGIIVQKVPINLTLGDTVIKTDDASCVDSFLEIKSKTKQPALTAAISPDEFVAAMEPGADGVESENIFVVTISSFLSSTYNNALVAKDACMEKLTEKKNKFIHIFDSLSASVGQTVVSLKLIDLIKRKVCNSQLVDDVNAFINEHKVYFLLENYDSLVKSGRINPYVAKVASMLNIQPICHNVNGKIEMADKARGSKKAMAKLVDLVTSRDVNFEERTLAISYVKCHDKAAELEAEIKKKVKFKDVLVYEANTLIANFADVNGLVCAF